MGRGLGDLRRVAAAALGIGLLAPAPALAGALTRTSDGSGNVVYTFAGGNEADSLTATRSATTVTFTNPGAVFADGGGLLAAMCTGVNTTTVTCPGGATQFVLNGNNGNDVMTVLPVTFAGPTAMTGGTGTDTLTGAAGTDSLNGGADGDALTGNDGGDSLVGIDGNDTLTGGDGNDTLSGGGGTDALNGGNGDDSLIPGLDDDNTVTGGDDSDTVSYDDGRQNGVSVNLATTGTQEDGGPDDGPAGARENLVGVEHVTGTARNDALVGDLAGNVLRGLAGDDSLNGGDGADQLIPGVGDDGTVQGGSGTDLVSYNDGRTNGVSVDLAAGGATDGGPDDNPDPAQREALSGVENVDGTALADVLRGDGLPNQLRGFAGNDEIAGLANAAGAEVLAGGDGNDRIDGGADADTVSGEGGDDALGGGPGADTVIGGAGSDRLDGGDGADGLAGSDDAGNLDVDTIDYSERADPVTVTANAGGANDGGSVDGPPAARDTVSGAEVVIGGAGSDSLTSDDTGLRLEGGAGDDALTGRAGRDALAGGPGADTMDGGDGLDTGDYSAAADALTVTLNAGSGDDGGVSDTSGAVRDTTLGLENLVAGPGADRIVGDGGPNALFGGDGDDVLVGDAGADQLDGGAGTDIASYEDRAPGQNVVATLDGLAGDGEAGENDAVGADIEGLAGGAGDDALTGDNGPNPLSGGDGADRITGLAGVDPMSAGPGDDTLVARDGTAEPVDCGPGSDGGVADAEDRLTACETVDAGPAPVVDADRDGYPLGTDCDDANAKVHPGTKEIVGNRLDEDCDGLRDAFVHIRLKGRIKPAPGARALSCKGTVDAKLYLKPKGRRIALVSTRLRNCRWRATAKLRVSTLKGAKVVLMRWHFGGNRIFAADDYPIRANRYYRIKVAKPQPLK